MGKLHVKLLLGGIINILDKSLGNSRLTMIVKPNLAVLEIASSFRKLCLTAKVSTSTGVD